MADPIEEEQLVFNRQLGGAEDLIFGFGSESQIRDGDTTIVTYINSAHIPYDSTRSVKQVVDEILLSLTQLGA